MQSDDETAQLLREVLTELRSIGVQLVENRKAFRTFAADALFALGPRDPKSIVKALTQEYSQNCEDAVIAEIYARIGPRSKIFVELGTEDGVRCNTRALLEQGWRGIWIEGNPDHVKSARQKFQPYLKMGILKCIEAMVTPDDIDEMLASALEGAEIDFLSVDIDFNTSHIWRAIKRKARVACVEYNAAIPPTVEWEVPNRPLASWDKTNYYGASLKTLEKIGREKQMALVGCDFHGINAFFVADAECGEKFLSPATAEHHFEPPRYKLVGHRSHPSSKEARSIAVR